MQASVKACEGHSRPAGTAPLSLRGAAPPSRGVWRGAGGTLHICCTPAPRWQPLSPAKQSSGAVGRQPRRTRHLGGAQRRHRSPQAAVVQVDGAAERLSQQAAKQRVSPSNSEWARPPAGLRVHGGTDHRAAPLAQPTGRLPPPLPPPLAAARCNRRPIPPPAAHLCSKTTTANHAGGGEPRAGHAVPAGPCVCGRAGHRDGWARGGQCDLSHPAEHRRRSAAARQAGQHGERQAQRWAPGWRAFGRSGDACRPAFASVRNCRQLACPECINTAAILPLCPARCRAATPGWRWWRATWS